MKPPRPSLEIPPDYRQEYDELLLVYLKSRVFLAGMVTTGIFLGVSALYWVREHLLEMETFDPRELSAWALMLIGTAAVSMGNARTGSIRESKIWGAIYSVVFLVSLGIIELIYFDHAVFFSFYFAFGLILSSLMIPWTTRDVSLLALLYAAAFTFYYLVVTRGIGAPVLTLSRFHPYYDGMVFLAITWVICIVIRRNETTRDIRNFLLRKEIETKNSQMESELDIAKIVHKTLLPEPIRTENVDVAVSYVPVGKVGGDYARLRLAEPDRALFFISDVTGHGVPAALLVNRVHAEFERLVAKAPQPGFLLAQLNRFICREFRDTDMYLSAFCCELNFRTMQLAYSNYGHPSQYLYRAEPFTIRSLESQTTLLGMASADSFEQYQTHVPFERGDGLLLYTDGVIETESSGGEMYGDERLMQFLRFQAPSRNGRSLDKLLLDELHGHKGITAFRDDIFILDVRTLAKSG